MVAINPLIVLVPGAWHSPASFDLLNPIFQKQNYDTWAIQLPSVGISPGLSDNSADVAAVRAHVSKVIDEDNRDVVLVMHSYAGIPGTDAMKGLGKKERGSAGKATGVSGLVYIASTLPGKGGSLMVPEDEANVTEEEQAMYPPILQMKHLEDGNSIAENPAETWLNGVEPALVEIALGQLENQTHSTRTFGSPLTYETYRDIPSAYLICENDLAIAPPKQRRLANAAGIKIQGTVKSGHSPFLSHPQQVVDFVIEALAKM